jgi:hypothetical protein
MSLLANWRGHGQTNEGETLGKVELTRSGRVMLILCFVEKAGPARRV